MDGDMKKLQGALSAVQSHLQDLSADQRATTHEIKALGDGVRRLEARSLSMEARLIGLAALLPASRKSLGEVNQFTRRVHDSSPQTGSS